MRTAGLVLAITFPCPFRQLKIDEFESNVNEVKDPYPSADFPGERPGTMRAGGWGRLLPGDGLPCVPSLEPPTPSP